MPKRSFDEFQQEIAGYQSEPTRAMLQDLVAATIEIEADDIDVPITDFALSRIQLAYRTGNVQTHLRHLYDVLAVVEREMARS